MGCKHNRSAQAATALQSGKNSSVLQAEQLLRALQGLTEVWMGRPLKHCSSQVQAEGGTIAVLCILCCQAHCCCFPLARFTCVHPHQWSSSVGTCSDQADMACLVHTNAWSVASFVLGLAVILNLSYYDICTGSALAWACMQ